MLLSQVAVARSINAAFSPGTETTSTFHYGKTYVAKVERHCVVLAFQTGKRVKTMDRKNEITRDEAQAALNSIETMESAGYRRAVPRRWFGAGIAFFIASLFALYALQDPYPYIVLPILGIAILIVSARESAGAYGRDFPATKASKLAFVLFTALMLVAFLGSIFIRRAYDVSWLPVVVGLLAGLLVFWISEGERRSYLAKAEAGQVK